MCVLVANMHNMILQIILNIDLEMNMKVFFYAMIILFVSVIQPIDSTNSSLQTDGSFVAIDTHESMSGCSVLHSNFHINCENELVMAGVCLTRLANDSGLVAYGKCPYITFHKIQKFRGNLFYHIDFEISTLTEETCGPLNRKGLLCSECYEGYGPAVYAFGNKCVKCHGSVYSRWALYLFVTLLPITVFYFIVIVFNINAAAPPLTAFVLYCQIFVTINQIYMPRQLNLISYYKRPIFLLALTLSGLWNLDFGRYIVPPLCVSDRLTAHDALLLDYVTGFYPMLLILITYVLIKLHGNNFKPLVMLWKPFHRCISKVRRTWDSKASILNAFTTFLQLSLTKILFISFYSIQVEALHVTVLNYSEEQVHYAYYYNPNIRTGSRNIIPIIALSYAIMAVFVFIPTILLCFYPLRLFRKVLFVCCGRFQHTVDLFMEAFQGYFKDGTNGTYDFRFLAGVYPLLRIIIMLSFLHSYHRDNTNNYSVMWCIVVSSIFSLVGPYKKLIHNRVNIVLLSLITFMMWYVTDFWPISLYQHKLLDHIGNIIILVLLVLVPHLVFASVVIHKALQLLVYRCGNGQPTICCVPTCLTVLRSRAIGGENEDELALALDTGN